MALNRALTDRYQLPFPILSDVDQQTIRDWGLFNTLDPKQRPIPHPASYLLGPERRVLWRYLGATARDRPTTGELLNRLRES